MKTLNLVYPEKSDIKYEISKFPDGQQQITLENIEAIPIESYICGTNKSYLIELKFLEVEIKSRLNNFQDLELIICAVRSLYQLGTKRIHLYVPYFLGSRSDRQFEEGSNNYLKDVICPIINSLNFDSVTILDPHSDVLEACLNNFNKESNRELVEFAIDSIYNLHYINSKDKEVYHNYILISPDSGATKKVHKLVEQIGYKKDIITCSKERDIEGKLTKTIFPFQTHKYNGEDFIIIDDILDGGQTFINIARKIKDCFAIREANQRIIPGKIYLIITHGIFSKGLGELQQYFDGIYCTNSYSDIKLNHDDGGNIVPKFMDKFKQLNIF